MKELKVIVNNKQTSVYGNYVGNLFCVDSASIDNNPILTQNEKESLKKEFEMNRNILIE